MRSSVDWVARRFELRDLDADIRGAPMVPMAMLNQMRRDLVEALIAATRALRRVV